MSAVELHGFYQDEDGDIWLIAKGEATLVWFSIPGETPDALDFRPLSEIQEGLSLTPVYPKSWMYAACPTCGK